MPRPRHTNAHIHQNRGSLARSLAAQWVKETYPAVWEWIMTKVDEVHPLPRKVSRMSQLIKEAPQQEPPAGKGGNNDVRKG